MKVIVIGSTGTIGSAVVNLLADEHQVIGASRSSDLHVDLQDPDTLKVMFRQHPDADAILCIAGDAAFGPLDELTDDQIAFGINNKLMGQINLVRIARRLMKESGIIVLTTGILAQNPNPHSSMLTMINRGLEGFVEAASLDMPRNQKLHAVSPPMARKQPRNSTGAPAAYRPAISPNYTSKPLHPLNRAKCFRVPSDL